MTDIQKQLAEALQHALHVMNSTLRDRKNIADLRTAIEIGQAVLAAHRQQEAREPLTLPAIDYKLLIADCYRITKHPQGTPGCVAFARGAEWYRALALAAHGIKGE